MSLLTPVKVPVKVYRWDDAGAPALDKTAGCMMTIFKACLVTGYGTKEGAGWTMPYEDAAAAIKVFRPEVSPHTDFYLRCYEDTGRKMRADIYLNMTDVNSGDKIISPQTPFNYSTSDTVKWVLIATSRGIWFFAEHGSKTGFYITLGDTAQNSLGNRDFYYKCTGGNLQVGASGSAFYYHASIFETSGAPSSGTNIYIYDGILATELLTATSMFKGISIDSSDTLASPVYLKINNRLLSIHAFASSNLDSNVFDVLDGGRKCINISTALNKNQNFFIPIDYWEY